MKHLYFPEEKEYGIFISKSDIENLFDIEIKNILYQDDAVSILFRIDLENLAWNDPFFILVFRNRLSYVNFPFHFSHLDE